MSCPRCGRPYAANHMFCEACGSPVQGGALPPPVVWGLPPPPSGRSASVSASQIDSQARTSRATCVQCGFEWIRVPGTPLKCPRCSGPHKEVVRNDNGGRKPKPPKRAHRGLPRYPRQRIIGDGKILDRLFTPVLFFFFSAMAVLFEPYYLLASQPVGPLVILGMLLSLPIMAGVVFTSTEQEPSLSNLRTGEIISGSLSALIFFAVASGGYSLQFSLGFWSMGFGTLVTTSYGFFWWFRWTYFPPRYGWKPPRLRWRATTGVVPPLVVVALIMPLLGVVMINVTGITVNGACGQTLQESGFSELPNSEYHASISIQNMAQHPDCTIDSVSTSTEGFILSNANTPLNIPFDESGNLTFVIVGSHAYDGNLTVDIVIEWGGEVSQKGSETAPP